MGSFWGQLDRLLSIRDRWARLGIECAMFLSALLEMAGIGVFVVAVRFFLVRKTGNSCWWLLLAVVSVLIVKNLFAYWIVVLQAKFVYTKQRAWSEALFDRYLHGDLAEIKRRGGADCALSLSRVALLCDRALLPAMQLIADSMLVVALMLALACYLPYIALSGIFFGGLTTGLIYLVFYRKNRQLGAAAGKIDFASGKLAARSLDAVETVRAFSGENFFADRHAAYLRQLAALRAKLYDFGQAPRLILESAALLYLLGLFGVMLYFDLSREAILLDFAALIAAMSRLLPAFSRMHYSVALVRQYQGLFGDLYCDLTALEVEDTRSLLPDFSISGGVEIRDLAFSYTPEKLIFDHFDLAVAPNECVGITGRTGCGKSTLFALLLGFYAPRAGKILFDGHPLPEVLQNVRRQTGFVPQQSLLFADTLRHNLTLGAEISDAAIWSALKMACIDDFVRSLPGELDFVIDNDGNNLSGGQRQRLAIARALCRDGVKLLLLDEATSALDTMTEAEFSETLAALHGKVTMLVISHREAALACCDRIVALDAKTGRASR